MIQATTEINLENITLNEISQTQKDSYCMVLLTCDSQKQATLQRQKAGKRLAEVGGNGELLLSG